MSIIKKIADFFRGSNPLVNTEVSTHDDSRRNKKVKKNKGSVVDNSIDNSTQIAGDQINDSHDSIIVGDVPTKDLIVVARWNHLVPHKIEKVVQGIDSFNVLRPIDPHFQKATFSVDLTPTYSEKNSLYVLLQRNPYLKNIKLKAVKMVLDACTCQSDDTKSIIGLLDTPKAFTIQSSDFMIGNGEITLVFGFQLEGIAFRQAFVFTARKNSSEFFLREYSEPERDVDWLNYK